MGVRIKDLATRAAKLITGNAWLIVDDGGSNVNKVDYKELAKQIIEEYNTSSLGGSAQTVKSAIDALNSKFACVALGSVGNEPKTITSTDWTDVTTGTSATLAGGKYMFIATMNATWSQSGYQFFPGIKVDNVYASSLYTYALPQTNQPVTIMGYLNISSGTHTVSIAGRVTSASKAITIPAYQNSAIAFIHCT